MIEGAFSTSGTGKGNMTERYITLKVTREAAYNAGELSHFLNKCPPTHKLHSVIPVAVNQHGTGYFIIIFAPIDFIGG